MLNSQKKGLSKTTADTAGLYIGYQTAISVETQYITYEEVWTFGEGWGDGWAGRTASPIKSPSTQTFYIG